MATDMNARLLDLMAEWAIEPVPQDTGPALQALRKGILDSREVQLRAAQVVVSGGAGERASGSGAMKCLRQITALAPFTWSPLLVRAMVLAAWPVKERPIAGLVVAPWEAPVGQEERFRGAIEEWRRNLARGGTIPTAGVDPLEVAPVEKEGEAQRIPQGEASQVTVARTGALEGEEVLSALSYLANTTSGWPFKTYKTQLYQVLLAMIWDAEAAGGRREAIEDARLQASRLHELPNGSWAQISVHFLPTIESIARAVAPLGGPAAAGPDYQHLVNTRGNGWNYDGNWAPHFFRLLSAFREGIILIRRESVLWRHLESQNAQVEAQLTAMGLRLDRARVQLDTWADGLRNGLTTYSRDLDARVAAARPPELELLWWGEARYCHTRGAPFRKMGRLQQIWFTAQEAAARAERLPAAPASAYLARVLEELGHDITVQKPVIEWIEESWEWLREERPTTEPRLLELAKGDSTGLPASRTIAAAATGDRPTAEDVRTLHVNPDTRIDLGDWAGWIFHERLMARRLA